MAETSDEVKAWFKQEILHWRITGCVAYSILLQMLVSVVIVFLLNANLFSPLQWLKDGSSTVFSFSTFGYGIVLSAITTCLVISYNAQFKMHPTVFSRVSERIIHVVNVWRLLTVVGYVVAGGLIAMVYLRMAGSPYYKLSVSCYEDRRCINRHHVMMIFSACFVGLLYAIGLIDGNHGYVRFPIIQRSKHVQMKSVISTKMHESFCEVLANLKWFLLSYVLIGFPLENYLVNSLGWNVGHTTSIFATLYDLVDVQLWWSIFLVDTAVQLLFSIVAYFFAVFLTERHSFPIETSFESKNCHSLKNVLSCVDYPVLSYLLFMDLSLLSQQSTSKRKEIFSLSQPGGHPHHWNAILQSCLRLIRGMTDEITNFCEPHAKLMKVAYSTPSSTDVAYEMWRTQRFIQHHSSNNSAVHPDLLLSGNVRLPSQSLAHPFNIITSWKLFLQQKLDELWKYFINIPFVAYFVKESIETSVQKIFVSSQLHTWAIEALSSLTAASFEEDKYGVVQKDLSTILVCLLDLHQALNRLQKFELTFVPAKRTSRMPDSWPDQLKAALKFTVKSALYRIVTTFGSHLNAVSLSSEHRRHLNEYLAFQE